MVLYVFLLFAVYIGHAGTFLSEPVFNRPLASFIIIKYMYN